jgi:hypothetical protein
MCERCIAPLALPSAFLGKDFVNTCQDGNFTWNREPLAPAASSYYSSCRSRALLKFCEVVREDYLLYDPFNPSV